MWGSVGAHEWLRLPMFYLAAFHVTRNSRWQDLYLKYRDEALERTLAFSPSKHRCYVTLQLQYSLRLIYDLDTSVRSTVLPLMHQLAAFCEERAITNSREFADPKNAPSLCYPFYPWDSVTPLDQGYFDGLRFLNPAQSENPENRAFYPVREIGEGASVAAICPGWVIKPELLDAVDTMLGAIDYDHHYSVYAPLLLSCAHMLCLEKERLITN